MGTNRHQTRFNQADEASRSRRIEVTSVGWFVTARADGDESVQGDYIHTAVADTTA